MLPIVRLTEQHVLRLHTNAHRVGDIESILCIDKEHNLTPLLRCGYDKGLAVGSLAGAGTLGFLIPPSIPMIIYAVLAEESLLRLFTAGFLPGFALAACFMSVTTGR